MFSRFIGPMDTASVFGTEDSGFESQVRLFLHLSRFFFFLFCHFYLSSPYSSLSPLLVPLFSSKIRVKLTKLFAF